MGSFCVTQPSGEMVSDFLVQGRFGGRELWKTWSTSGLVWYGVGAKHIRIKVKPKFKRLQSGSLVLEVRGEETRLDIKWYGRAVLI